MLIPLHIPTSNGFHGFFGGAGFRPSTLRVACAEDSFLGGKRERWIWVRVCSGFDFWIPKETCHFLASRTAVSHVRPVSKRQSFGCLVAILSLYHPTCCFKHQNPPTARSRKPEAAGSLRSRGVGSLGVSHLQGNPPFYEQGIFLGSPFGGITEMDSIPHSPEFRSISTSTTWRSCSA